MKTHPENSRQVVDRFLGKLGEPLSAVHVERALGRVRERLEEPAALDAQRSAPVSGFSMRWAAVAATIVVMLAGGLAQLLFVQPLAADSVAKAVGGQIYLAGVRPLSPLSSLSSHIGAAQSIRTGADSGTIELNDGSRVEMGPQAELAVVPAADGMSVRLSSGTVIVTAAKQRKGHLYVETRDLVVSVVGTVFSVSAETTGSRVSVIEGEVHVQQGTTEQTLLPGQQASTTPALGPLPVQTELKWSKSAVELAALMEQAAPAPAAGALPAQTPSRVIQGTVKLASKQEGIAGVTITACPANASNAGVFRLGRTLGEDGQRALAYRVRISPQDGVVVTSPQAGTTIIRDKTFFFALWDGAMCANRSQVKTDASGRFQLQDLPPGDYAVRAEAEGYFGPAENGTYPAFASQMITVDPQQAAPEVSLSLIRGGTITGRIRDAEGKLAVNVQVWAGVSASPDKFNTVASKATDDRGEYRLFWLPPGEYYVGVGGQNPVGGILRYYNVGATGAQQAVTWNVPGQAVFPAPAQSVFPNGASISEGKAIVVREGEEVVGIDIMMRPTPPSDAPVTPLPALPNQPELRILRSR